MVDALSRHHGGPQGCFRLHQLPIIGPCDPETHCCHQGGRRGQTGAARLLERVDCGIESSPIEHEPAKEHGRSGRLVALASSGENARGA